MTTFEPSDLFDPSDLDIQDGSLKINNVLWLIKEVLCTKFEVDRPDSSGENVQKIINDL